MATISLYKDKVNGVGSLLDDIIKSVNNLDVQLGTLKNTLQGVDSSTCNLQDTVDSISSSSKSEKDKIADLKKLNGKLTDFIETTTNRDNSARDEINKQKDDFYTKYKYLKPECEKSRTEKFVESLKKVCDWCKEHWKLIATIVIVVVSVAVLLIPGVGPIIAGACWGAIMGAVIGGVSGGLESMAQGGSFLKGFEDGALSGAISGAISGAAFAGIGQLGAAAGNGLNALKNGAACTSKIGKVIKGTAAVTKVMDTAMGGFDMVAMADKYFGSGNIAALNDKLHSSKAYNFFQTGVSVTAAFTGGMTSTMKCFISGTLVMTASGKVPIELIKTGDMVLATDPETMQTGFKPVLETYIRETNTLVHLTINGEEIVSTYDHPFFVKGQGFVNAVNLCIGSVLLNSKGEELVVEQIFREELKDGETVKVYNFKVDDYHTYFVGENCIWVHNSECGGSYKDLKKDKDGKLYEKEEIHHMPADNSSPLARGDGPAIRMDKADHRQTASCGRSKKAQAHRAKQKSLIQQGKFREAVKMDIKDIRSKFGNKYDKGIGEMWKYINELERNGKI
ncbi:polymorphic toxin-type HINT domain-containing protein [uncultured Ruminococcus sp.]|uniref:polymorphic toxin-type HINT domain-containing protein n=1 Tax=uncultured Ruminococcus sp. TaxID=165186 RepID=UPI00261F69AA|nr:polymorphic toxin-type HINT domain-containing protein [uncultured Ruminococcus sp.]